MAQSGTACVVGTEAGTGAGVWMLQLSVLVTNTVNNPGADFCSGTHVTQFSSEENSY